jgi:hypothetical protein
VNHETGLSQLRILARDFAEGRIQREEYLRRRTAFLDALGKQGPRRIHRPPTPAAPPSAAPDTRAAAETAASPKARNRKPLVLAAIGAVAILLGVGAGLLFIAGNESPTDERKAAIDDPPPLPDAGPAPNRPPDADEGNANDEADAVAASLADDIRLFLDDANWGNAGVLAREQLVEQWQGYSAQVQERVRSEPEFRRLERELRETLKLERALGKSGDEVASLLDFGQALGIAVGFSALPAGPTTASIDAPTPSAATSVESATATTAVERAPVETAGPTPPNIAPADDNAAPDASDETGTADVTAALPGAPLDPCMQSPDADGCDGPGTVGEPDATPTSVTAIAGTTEEPPSDPSPPVDRTATQTPPPPPESAATHPERVPASGPEIDVPTATANPPSPNADALGTPATPPAQDDAEVAESQATPANGDDASPPPARANDAETTPVNPLTLAIPAAMLRPGSAASPTGPDSGGGRVLSGTPTAARPVPTESARPASALPPLGQRLPSGRRSDVCARAAARLQDPAIKTLRCRDGFLRSSRSKGPQLIVIPGNNAPFTLTTRAPSLTLLKKWWCSRDRRRCAGADPSSQRLNDTQIGTLELGRAPDDPQTLARDYAETLTELTGYQYRIATRPELIEAARLGLDISATELRLTRQLTLKQGSQEAKALERWWHHHLTRANQ